MARYIGGPLDGRDIVTPYDHLPVISLPCPRGGVVRPETIEDYRLDGRTGARLHEASRPFQHKELTP